MQTVVQRTHEAVCRVDETSVGSIGQGLVVFLGVAEGDTRDDVDALVDKLVELRVFPDDQGKMNEDLTSVDGEVLLVPNFTLCADVNQGRRPSFDGAAPPNRAEELYELFADRLRDRLGSVETGRFGAMMDVEIANDGPVTLVVDSDSLETGGPER